MLIKIPENSTILFTCQGIIFPWYPPWCNITFSPILYSSFYGAKVCTINHFIYVFVIFIACWITLIPSTYPSAVLMNLLAKSSAVQRSLSVPVMTRVTLLEGSFLALHFPWVFSSPLPSFLTALSHHFCSHLSLPAYFGITITSGVNAIFFPLQKSVMLNFLNYS